jgi:hypothetical protein
MNEYEKIAQALNCAQLNEMLVAAVNKITAAHLKKMEKENEELHS